MSDISFQSVKHFELGPSVPHAHEPSALPVGGGGGVAVDVVGAILQRLRDRGLQDDEEEREDEGGEESGAGRLLLGDGRGYAGEQLHSAWEKTIGSNGKTVSRFSNIVQYLHRPLLSLSLQPSVLPDKLSSVRSAKEPCRRGFFIPCAYMYEE